MKNRAVNLFVRYLFSLLFFSYRYNILRKLVIKIVVRLENGDVYSETLRKIFLNYHNIRIGKYSYGGCFSVGVFPSGTVIGNYCSFGSGLKVYRRNHPSDFLSQHPFFYNSIFKFVNEDKIHTNADNPLIIGSDVWVGSGVTFLPGCKKVGVGAIIGADSVVTKDIPDFAIAVGNPAKVIKYRFDSDLRDKIVSTSWWDLDIDNLVEVWGGRLFKDFLIDDIK